MIPAIGTVIDDRYRLERELGRGGMAVVFAAHDLRHERSVAIKVLRPELVAADGGERFAREIRITAQLSHPHIVGVLDSGTITSPGDAPVAWFAMPLVEGESLRARLERDRVLPVDEAVRLAAEVADAMAFAHGRGVIHRDLKPDNVLLAGGHAQVADFGIARALDAAPGPRLTETGFSLGTPAYMSPEQAAGERDVDARADLYALGCILYEMLAGEPPFGGPTAQAVVAKHLAQPAPSVRITRATVPQALDRCITRALAKEPADRFASADEMRSALLAAVAPPPAGRRRGLGVAVGAVALLGLGLGVAAWWRRTTSPPGSAAPSPKPVLLAVLPFQNLSPDSADAYFADGLTEEITSTLGQVGGLSVLSRGSAATLDGSNPVQRARDAGVRYLLEGSVRKEGPRSRISVRLSDATTGTEVWNRTFDRSGGKLLGVEVDVGHAVAAGLQGQLPSGAESGLKPPPTRNLEAYDLFLRSLSGQDDQGRGVDQRIALLERAVALDPAFVAAWAALSRAWLASAVWARVPLGQVIDSARSATDRALAIDSASAEAWSALALIRFRYDWDWPGALAAHEQALRLNPNSADIHHEYARTLRSLGRFAESQTQYALADQLDPISKRASGSRGRAFYYARDYERALEVYRATPDGTPLFAAEALLQLGRFREAGAVLAAGADSTDWSGLPLWAYYWAVAGPRDRAVAALQRLEAAAQTRYVHPVLMALAYTGLGDRDAAFRWLERAYRDRNERMVDLMVEPRFDPLRSDPRFTDLLHRMRFPTPTG